IGGSVVAVAAIGAGLALAVRSTPSRPISYQTRSLGAPGDLANVALSPDGRSVAAIAGSDLFTIDVATGKHDRLAAEAWPDSHRIWSPDGSTIAYHRATSAGDGEANVLVELTTRKVIPVTGFDPSFVPLDGRRGVRWAAPSGELQMTDLDGGRRTTCAI